VTALLDAGTPEALDARLRAAGIDHVAIYRNHLVVAEAASAEGLRAERTTTLSPDGAARLRAFLDAHTTVVAASDVAAVHRLDDP
ncbi:MAG: hypothetical protein H6719_35095, partial [Sandaracinaceae bacterium]|nr:hypothetical protein [Sandaracinaceae bacterium]